MPAISILSRSVRALVAAFESLAESRPPSRRRGSVKTGVEACVST